MLYYGNPEWELRPAGAEYELIDDLLSNLLYSAAGLAQSASGSRW